MQKGLTYDDVLLVPQYSDIESRSEVSLTTDFGRGVELGLPIIASPMDTVSEADMAGTLGELGGISIVHRYNSIEEQSAMIASLGENTLVGAAVELVETLKIVQSLLLLLEQRLFVLMLLTVIIF